MGRNNGGIFDMSVSVNGIECIGRPAQCERFAIYCDNPNDNTEMIGRMFDGRAFTTWAQIIKQASAQAVSPIYRIKALDQ